MKADLPSEVREEVFLHMYCRIPLSKSNLPSSLLRKWEVDLPVSYIANRNKNKKKKIPNKNLKKVSTFLSSSIWERFVHSLNPGMWIRNKISVLCNHRLYPSCSVFFLPLGCFSSRWTGYHPYRLLKHYLNIHTS